VLRRLIVVSALTAGMSIAAVMTLATPALAKGPSQARISGPGLPRAVVVSGTGEPGMQTTLARLAAQTGLFTVLFGPGGPKPAPARLHTPPPVSSRGPRYTVIFTVPGVTPQAGEQFGMIRLDVYPLAVGGPLIYTPPGQAGFGRPLQVSGWLQGGPQLASTLGKLGVPPPVSAARRTHVPVTAHPAAAHQAGQATSGWLIGSAVALAAAALATGALRRRRRSATAGVGEPGAGGPAPGSA
jgi:hypothetical protein